MSKEKQNIVIVGGGAGGLELAVRLAKSRLKNKINIILVDDSLKYVWKPLYHEVAVGTLNYAQNELNYIDYAYHKGINFVLGFFSQLNREKKEIFISPVYDEHDHEIIPGRHIHYDYLVIAVGSTSNTFNIPGVKDNCFFLDRLAQAERFQKDLLFKILSFIQTNPDHPLRITIVGGGATGVELAAELRYGFLHAVSYSKTDKTIEKKLKISVIEAADRILPGLLPDVSKKVADLLKKMGIQILTSKKVTRAEPNAVLCGDEEIDSDIIVWAAGIKAPDFLAHLGLACNKINQIEVKSTLQSVTDNSIYALGDCAACLNFKTQMSVPPRAQAARQQAILLTKSFRRIIAGESPLEFNYQDHGSLVALSGGHNVVGSLMGKVLGPFFIEGEIALLSYWLLHKLHQTTLFGPWKAFLLMVSNLFTKRLKSRVKLH